jgi:predicted nucleic acid-binding protein
VVEDAPAPRVVPSDPKDDYLVALARAGGAHVIVTGDRHLLDMDELRPPALEPRAFLAVLERVE